MVTYVADLWEMEISDQQLSPNSGDQGSEIRDQESGPALYWEVASRQQELIDKHRIQAGVGRFGDFLTLCQMFQTPRKPWNSMGEKRENMVYWGTHQATQLHCSAPSFTVLHCTSLHFTALCISRRRAVFYSNELQLTSLHCIKLYCSAVYCTQCTGPHCGGALNCITLRYCTKVHCTIL